jgi:Na+/melibiose symporter-like transporter
VFTSCLVETCETIFTANWRGLFPDKFRGREERIKASSIIVYIGIIGVVFANLLPPIIIVLGQMSTYALMAWICAAINLFVWVPLLPGSRDDKECVENYLAICETQEKEPFLKTMKNAFKSKSFIAFLIFYIAYQSNVTIVQANFLYWVNFIIFGSEDDVLFVMVFLLIGVMIGVIPWYKYSKKTGNNRKIMIYAGIIFVSLTFFLSIVLDLITLLIVVLLWGMGLGGFWVMVDPTFSDVVDESISITGARREGFYMGFRSLVSNLSRVVQAFFFSLVHELTGFIEGPDVEVQPPAANIGILILFGVIPAIIMGIGLIIFWMVYDITPEKAAKTRERLIELNI